MATSGLWPEDVPEEFKGPEPRGRGEKQRYLKFWVGYYERKLADGSVDRDEYRRLLIGLKRRLDDVAKKLANLHDCECCGLPLTVSSKIGPECAKHPDKFPCRSHQRRTG